MNNTEDKFPPDPVETTETPQLSLQTQELPPASPAPQTTPAQARVDAVSATLAEGYAKASLVPIIPEEAAELSADFPDDAFRTGADGKENLIYIEHANLRERLNKVLGLGQWAIITRRTWMEQYKTRPSRDNPEGKDATRVYVECVLLVRGCFAAEAIGDMTYYPSNYAQNYGDAVEGAKSAALRRCAKELGVGLQAWKKEYSEGWFQRKLERDVAEKQGHRTVPGSVQNAGTRVVHVTPAPAPAMPVQAPKPVQTFKSDNERRNALNAHLEACRVALIKTFDPVVEAALLFFKERGFLLPTDDSLERVPALQLFPSVNYHETPAFNNPGIKADRDALMKEFRTFCERSGGGTDEPEPEPENNDDQIPGIEVNVPHGTKAEAQKPKRPWESAVLPFAPKDAAKKHYKGKTLGELFVIDRKYAWGLAKNFVATPWTNPKGETVPPTAAAVEFARLCQEWRNEHNE